MLNYRKHNLWRVFVDFLLDNDEKVASSVKNTPIKARVQKPYLVYDQNGQKSAKIDTLFMTKTAEKAYPLGRAYLYSPYKGVPPPPRGRLN